MNMGGARPRPREPGARRRDRDVGRRRRGLALGVVHPRHPRRRSSRVARVLHEGAAARAVREGGRARRGRSRTSNPAPISMEAAFARLKRIRTIRTVLVGVLRARLRAVQPAARSSRSTSTTPSTSTSVAASGASSSASAGIVALPFLPFVGALLRPRRTAQNPAKALALVGAADPAVGAVHAAAVLDAQHDAGSSILEHPAGGAHRRAAFAMVGPVLQAVVPVPPARHGHRDVDDVHLLHRRLPRRPPRRLPHRRDRRARHGASSSASRRAIIGGLLLMNGARFIRNDLSLVVEELLEEQEEHRKRTDAGRRASPVLQVANIDFSYGPVQVLFDVNFEVQQGETRRAARHQRRRQVDDPARRSAGSRCPNAASCGSTASNITYVAPETARPASGSCSCPAARACSRSLTVEQNLARQRAAQRAGRSARSTQRVADVLELFPELARAPEAARRAACRAASSRCSRSRAC